jgi:hypothetical protein
VSAPLTGDRKFRNDPVRIADLTVNRTTIEDYEFVNCRILGPAVLIIRDSTITACSWDAPGLDSIFWEISPARLQVVGAVGVFRCLFSNCRFEGIGIAGPPEMRAMLEGGFR